MTPIEYIGPVPKKKRKKPVMGGWVIMLLAGMFVSYFAWPAFAELVKSSNDMPTDTKVETAISELSTTGKYGDRLAAAALDRTRLGVIYDGSVYNNIGYPNGDISPDRGTSTDMVVRAYRQLGVDLQQLIHEDMKENYHLYPQLWNQRQPDTNIDHRRVQNQQRFFERHGVKLENSRSTDDYTYGDIVVWSLPNGRPHIGIVVPGPGTHSSEVWVAHNNGEGPEWTNDLLTFTVTGHFRYQGE
jgi:uncharacterized protein YijF (DUF1287 family)